MRADIIAEDREGRIFLVVEVEARPSEPGAADDFMSCLHQEVPNLLYGMFVDLDEIAVYALGRGAEVAEVLRVSSREILGAYAESFRGRDTHYGSPSVLEHYMVVLVESWLADLSYRWKLPVPPGLEPMTRIGLVDLLKEGTTRIEVLLAEALR